VDIAALQQDQRAAQLLPMHVPPLSTARGFISADDLIGQAPSNDADVAAVFSAAGRHAPHTSA
jgi:hypothetical protein